MAWNAAPGCNNRETAMHTPAARHHRHADDDEAAGYLVTRRAGSARAASQQPAQQRAAWRRLSVARSFGAEMELSTRLGGGVDWGSKRLEERKAAVRAAESAPLALTAIHPRRGGTGAPSNWREWKEWRLTQPEPAPAGAAAAPPSTPPPTMGAPFGLVGSCASARGLEAAQSAEVADVNAMTRASGAPLVSLPVYELGGVVAATGMAATMHPEDDFQHPGGATGSTAGGARRAGGGGSAGFGGGLGEAVVGGGASRRSMAASSAPTPPTIPTPLTSYRHSHSPRPPAAPPSSPRAASATSGVGGRGGARWGSARQRTVRSAYEASVDLSEWSGNTPKQLLFGWFVRRNLPCPRLATRAGGGDVDGGSDEGTSVGGGDDHLTIDGMAHPSSDSAAAATAAAAVVSPGLFRGAAIIGGGLGLSGGGRTFQTPPSEMFASKDEAEQAAATMALLRLFPDLPMHRRLPRPYDSLYERWSRMQRAAAEYSRQVSIPCYSTSPLTRNTSFPAPANSKCTHHQPLAPHPQLLTPKTPLLLRPTHPPAPTGADTRTSGRHRRGGARSYAQ